MLDKRAVLLAKVETTYNTDAVPVAGTDAILVEDLGWAFANARMYERKPVRSSLAALAPRYAGALITISGKCELKGSGAAGSAPEVAPLLRGAGMSEAVVASTSVTYKPSSTSTDWKSLSMYFYDDGLLVKVTGARVKVTFDFQVGQAPLMTFEATGHFVSITDAALPSATYDSTVPPMLLSVPFDIGSYSAVISKLDFDLGNELSMPENIAAADGFGEVTLTGRRLTGSFNPLRVTVATKNFVDQWQTRVSAALTTGVIGSTAGNRLRVDMPAVTYTEAGRGNQNNVGTYEMKFHGAESAGDDEVSLIFT